MDVDTVAPGVTAVKLDGSVTGSEVGELVLTGQAYDVDLSPITVATPLIE
jgi:hypothetical protein